MAHLDAYIQPCPGFGWSGGPEFSTEIVQLNSGREKRNSRWAEARHRYSAPYTNITKEAYREIKRMHLVCRGCLHAFRFRDELDCEATSEIFSTGDGTTTVFQLRKISLVDGVSYVRNVYAPTQDVVITANGAPVSPTIDFDRGTVTFDTAPGVGVVLRWTGTFDVWVRFDQDYLPFSIDNLNATNGSVELVEVAEPALEPTP